MRKAVVASTDSKSKDTKGGDKKEADGPPVVANPRKIFSAALESIWLDIASSEISKGALQNPPIGSDPLDFINTRIHSNQREQSLLIENLKQPTKKIQKFVENTKGIGFFFGSSTQSDSSQGLSGSPSNRSNQGGGAGGGGPDSASDDGNSASNIDDDAASQTASQFESSSNNGGTESVTGVPVAPKADTSGLDDEIFDDGLTTITADEYVKLRLLPLVASFTVKAPGMSSLVSVVTVITIMLSVASSVFSTFNLVIFIPIALAFSGSLTAWTSYNQTDLRLVRYTHMMITME